LHALLIGDHDAARHLGYYAELRAAMSLLAVEGIGVFDKKHVVVGERGRCLRMPRRPNGSPQPLWPATHVFVWEGLEEWVSAPTSAGRVLSLISAGGSNLEEWMNHVGTIPGFMGQLAKDWLLGWGVDISQLADDRDARNLSSYRPTSFTTGRPETAAVVSQFVSALWRLCEPTQQNPFSRLDRILVRASLHRAFKAANGYAPSRANKRFSRFINQQVLAGLQPAVTPGVDWSLFLTDLSAEPVDVLLLASRRDRPTSASHALQVASRAFLLLRISTGLVERLISTLAPGAIADLEFWCTEIGEDRALWVPNARPASVDLWIDTQDALDEVEQGAAQIDSYHALWRILARAAQVLTSWERVCLWGLRL
jgi:hypothetical protein